MPIILYFNVSIIYCNFGYNLTRNNLLIIYQQLAFLSSQNKFKIMELGFHFKSIKYKNIFEKKISVVYSKNIFNYMNPNPYTLALRTSCETLYIYFLTL